MAKPLAGAAAVGDGDGWAVGCVGVLSLRCVCFTATKMSALISRTTRTRPVTMWGTGGRCRDRLDVGTVPLPLTLNTVTGYSGIARRGPTAIGVMAR